MTYKEFLNKENLHYASKDDDESYSPDESLSSDEADSSDDS